MTTPDMLTTLFFAVVGLLWFCGGALILLGAVTLVVMVAVIREGGSKGLPSSDAKSCAVYAIALYLVGILIIALSSKFI